LVEVVRGRGVRVLTSRPPSPKEPAAELGVYDGSPYAAEFAALTPLGRLGTPEDIAKAAVVLASDQAQWITGDILKASGGMY
jgi:3-oxoacyl-[acyl-carrier protein] reductase